MTEYSIKLPQGNNVKTPQLADETARIHGDMKLALSAFDVDGQKGLSANELLQAFDYFVNKEKEIAVTGKKGDGIITSQDIGEIIKTDDKFAAIRDSLKDDNKVVELLSNIVMTLSALVQKNKDNNNAVFINSKTIEYTTDNGRVIRESDKMVTNRRSTIKEVEINGKKHKVQICTNEKGEEYVLSANGEYRYTTPSFVAKCLGYETESHWFKDDEYYAPISQDVRVPVEDSEHKAALLGKQYKVWNPGTNSFNNGKQEFNQMRHFVGTK